jgi:hypothetical protein
MIRTLRAFFLGRLLREKLLLLVFVLIGVLWWLTAFNKRAVGFWREQRTTTVELAEQQRWLDNRTTIEANAQKAASRLEPGQTLNGIRLVAAMNSAAYEAGLRNNYRSDTATSITNGQFTVYTVPFQVTGATYDTLLKFYLNVHKRAPYIGIDAFQLSANSGNRNLLNLQLRVSSVEIPR